MQRLWWWLRRTSKGLLHRTRLVTLIESCDRCGIRQPLTWHATDALWALVSDTYAGCYCPWCFQALLLERHNLLLMWKPMIHPADAPDYRTQWETITEKPMLQQEDAL